ncbi:hypothetical protein T439DRAFT_237002 [Meredithblackwellia eburnea MCA 4105]
MPPLPRLSRWASLATTFIIPAIPIVHRGTMFAHSEMLSPLAFALAVSGAGLEQNGRLFHEDMTKAKRIFAIAHLTELDFTFEERLSAFQAFCIYNASSLHMLSPEERDISMRAHSVLSKAYHMHQFPSLIREAGWNIPASFDDPNLHGTWATWVLTETLKRIACVVMLLDMTETNVHDLPSQVSILDFDVELPASDTLWNAETAETWVLKAKMEGDERPPSFLTILDALLSIDDAGSSQSDVLLTLPTMPQVTLSLLSQSLYRLQRQIERNHGSIEGGAVPLAAIAAGSASGAVVHSANGALIPTGSGDGLPNAIAWDIPAVALAKIATGMRALHQSGAPSPHAPWFRQIKAVFT